MTDTGASQSSGTPFPQEVSAVVIGGGVMGCSVLYHLAKLGLTDAILLERNQLTSGTTWHSAAQVRALRSTRNMTELIRYSVGLYSTLEEETGQATGWINKGSLSIATTPDRMVHIERQKALADLFGVDATTITPDEAQEIWPLMNAEDVLGAVWSPGDGRVSPSDLCAALVKGAKVRGARVFENTSVTGITTKGGKGGKVAGLETTRGSIKTQTVVICAGLWSKEAAAMAGAQAPVWPCEHFYLLTKPIDGITGNMPTLSDHDAHLYIRDDSGGLLVGCFEPLGKAISPQTLGPSFAFQLLPEDWDHFEPMMLNALHRLPPLETAEVKTLLNGPESFTPDGSFLLGEAPETQGLFLGCGMNSVGVATGGGAGMALAHQIVHGHMPFDLHEVDPARFPGCWQNAAALSERVPEVLGKHYEITYPGRQWTSARGIRKGPLYTIWADRGAAFGQVYGWERPLYFAGPKDPDLTFAQPPWFDAVAKEVAAAHSNAALFDQSTLGKISVSGPDAETFLNRVCTNNMARTPGAVIYTLMLNDQGGIIEDLTVLRLANDSYRLSVGSSAIRRVIGWLNRHQFENERVVIADETEQFATLALAGPNAPSIAEQVNASRMKSLSFFRHGEDEINGVPVLAARLSYVGEAGWEITCPADQAPHLCHTLMEADARPAGMYAQTSMRIEKRFLAYGHDIDTDSCPLASGLSFSLDWDSDFIGRDALRLKCEKPQTSRIVSLLFDDQFDDQGAWPLGNEPVYLNDTLIGQTTSASFGHRVRAPVALAVLSLQDQNTFKDGEQVFVDIAGNQQRATVHLKAVFDAENTRLR